MYYPIHTKRRQGKLEKMENEKGVFYRNKSQKLMQYIGIKQKKYYILSEFK